MSSVLAQAEPVADDQDFESVYRAHGAAVYRFCLSQLRELALAEDAAADVFAAALRAWHRVDHGTGVKLWLFGIARNVVADHYRAVRRRERLQQLLNRRHRTSAVPDPEGAVELRDDIRRVGEVVATLRRRDQVLLGLRVASDMSHREIAHVMGMSEEAVRVAIHRAVQKIRMQLESHDDQ
jgi:RNA polymerase sigma factor (sigma-70 family)